MAEARERFARWVKATGKSKADIGRLLRCSGVHVGYLLSGARRQVGIDLALKIERATAEWEEGPIRVEEWRVKRDESDSSDERAAG